MTTPIGHDPTDYGHNHPARSMWCERKDWPLPDDGVVLWRWDDDDPTPEANYDPRGIREQEMQWTYCFPPPTDIAGPPALKPAPEQLADIETYLKACVELAEKCKAWVAWREVNGYIDHDGTAPALRAVLAAIKALP